MMTYYSRSALPNNLRANPESQDIYPRLVNFLFRNSRLVFFHMVRDRVALYGTSTRATSYRRCLKAYTASRLTTIQTTEKVTA